ncbi:MAG: hypothetical protein MZV65_02320 [Chromatiales bacterium]|nr:hypothetical protein [Chromatiales bacterium]
MLGAPVGLKDVTLPVCAIACETDHIAPWKAASTGFASSASEDKTFILSESGHVAGIVNPPSRNKHGHYVNPAPVATPEAFRTPAEFHAGSWWPRWSEWLAARSGERIKARQPGDSKHPELAPAPGTYVVAEPARLSRNGKRRFPLPFPPACANDAASQNLDLICCTAAFISSDRTTTGMGPLAGDKAMTKTPDFTKVMQDMMSAFPVDSSAMQNAFKTQAAMAEKMSKVTLEAAEKSTEITAKWAKDTIASSAIWRRPSRNRPNTPRLPAISLPPLPRWPPRTSPPSPKWRRRCRWKRSS